MKIFLTLFCCILFTTCVLAQNNNSPYSIIGLGDIEKSSLDRTSGMGYAGIALNSNKSIYNSNPASYAALDNHFFHIESSFRFKGINYSGKPITSTTTNESSDLVTKKVSFTIKPRNKWGLSVGLLPYSNSNYSFYANKNIQGSNETALAYYEGTGSMNVVYVANAFQLAKNLYAGVQASYLFGQLKQEESIINSITNTITTSRNIFVRNPFIKFGVQYNTNLNKKINLAIGGTFSNKAKLLATYDLSVKNGTTSIASSEDNQSYNYNIPLNYTTGMAITYNKKYVWALDYSYQNWSQFNYTGINYKLVNSNRLSTGFELKHYKSAYNITAEKSFFQLGAFYNNSYLKISGQQIQEYGLTLGAGVHSFKNGLGLHATYEYGQRGTTNNGLIKEKYSQITISILYRDFWFKQRRVYD